MERIQQSRRARGQGGFTLIELLVVIVILGILAAVVVFAVGGIDDRGEASACEIDTRTIQTAQEAFFANGSPGTYTTEEGLVTGEFLSSESELHNIDLPGTGGRPYDITVQDDQCGSVGANVNTCGPAPGTTCADPTNL